jgi:DNA-binding CsgD family transcriptional regulator/tetratricopeptide (TPR) repeat protein
VVEVLERRAFVGRGTELARLRALLAEAAEGHGRTVILAGEAGIGKSRLAAKLAEVATERGVLVLEGACLETADDGVSYAPFVEILRELVRGTPPERLPALLGPGRAILTRLIPELASRAADVPVVGEPDRAAQARLFELILGVLERLAGSRPVVVRIEDVHWADRSTRELLAFLVRSLRDDPVVFLLALRTDDAGTAVGNLGLIAELERDEGVERIDLRPFGRDEVETQVANLLGSSPDARTIERLLSRSDGNPFYIEELVRAGEGLEGDLPAVLRDVLADRIAALSAPARSVLRAAATAGRRIDDELLAAVLEMPVRALGDALREAVASGVLVRAEQGDGPTIAFRHALLQEVVSAELFAGERVALHAAFAAALEARAATRLPTTPAEIARHWDAARRPDRALAPTVEAARAAERVYGFGEAHLLWERAAALLAASPAAAPTISVAMDELLEHAADAAVLVGDYEAAVRLGRAAIAAAEAIPSSDGGANPARVGHLGDRLRWYLWEAGDRQAARRAVEAALGEMPEDVPTLRRARALAQHAGILLFAGEYERARDEAALAVEVARAVDAPGEEALALGVLGWLLALAGDPDAGLASYREGQAIAERLGSVEGLALAAFNLASLFDRIGHSEASLEAAATGYATTERLGVARTYGGLLLGFRAKAEFLLGRWDEAEASTALGLRHGATDRAELWLAINRARLLIARGAFAEGRALLARARLVEAHLGPTEFLSLLLAAEAELATLEARFADVRAIAAEGMRLAAESGPPDPSLAWLAATVLRAEADAATAVRGRGTPEERAAVQAVVARIDQAAEAAAATARELASGSPRGRALLEQLRAERARVQGITDPSQWSDVARAWTEAARPYPAAYARYREAEGILGSRGSRDAAAAALAEAATISRRLGALPLLAAVEGLARQARIALPAVDGDARAAVRGGPNHGAGTLAALGLTPREAEVLRLVAGGWTNQQIADALFITRKTASVHVSNILAKLEVGDRTAAAATAHRLGLEAAEPHPEAAGLG